MADWTIRVAQSPIGYGTPYKHNIIVVVDSAGRAVYELNGGPLDADGKIIPFDDRRGPLAYLSGDFPVGAEKGIAGTQFYRPHLNQRVVFSGTEEQVRNRLQAADACIGAINSAGQKYTLLTDPRGGRDAPSTPTFNSNSVNASLLQCMGIPVGDPAITSQPGYENPILSQDQVQQIREQQNPTAPPPAGNIPIPRPQPQKRNDNWDNSNGAVFGQAAPAAEPVMAQGGAGSTATSGLPQNMPIFADLIPQSSDPQLKTAGQPLASQQVASAGGPNVPQHVIDAGSLLRANGYEITPRTMYLAHVLGPQAAVELIKRTGSTYSPAVPSPDAATGDQMRAWVRALRLGPATQAIGGIAPTPAMGPGQSNEDTFATAGPFA